MNTVPTLDRIYTGDALSVLKGWPESLVDLVVTSPPYFQLRDYGAKGQLGLESTPEEYVAEQLAVFRQVRRVLKDSGSLFLNLGDTYKAKSLVGIPWRVALALTEDGWLLRNAIVWHKTHGLPSSVKDRLTTSYEFVFHFTKSKVYFYDLNAIRVPNKGTFREGSETRRSPRDPRYVTRRPGDVVPGNFRPHPLGKNPGDVWAIGPETRAKKYIAPGEAAHFAPYPEALCERPILAASQRGGIVLDPFMGSGTTALVANRLDRHYVGIELSPEYAALARRRLHARKLEPQNRPYRSLSSRSDRKTRKRLPAGKRRQPEKPTSRPDLEGS